MLLYHKWRIKMNMYLEEKTPIQIILKLTGNDCNLNCTYCYEKKRQYDISDYMTFSTVEQLLYLLDDREISIQLHGGEPLLYGLNNTREILKMIKNTMKKIRVNVQSNGILLNEEWLKLFCCEYPATEIGISLDGDWIANTYRVDYQGINQTNKIEHALQLCTKYKKGIGIISVVNDKMIGREREVLEYFRQFPCIRGINFTPYYDFKIVSHNNSDTHGSINIQEYHDFLKNIFLLWKTNVERYKFIIDPFFNIIRSLLAKGTTSCHYSKFKCANMFTVYPNGELGCCDEINTRYKNLGNIFEFHSIDDLILKQKQHSLFRDAAEINKKCKGCKKIDICQEGCISSRLNFCDYSKEDEYCLARCDLIDFVADNLND